MKFVFATSTCSKKTYERVFNMRKRKLIDPAQKFFEQLMVGVAKNDSACVVSISALPVSASTVNKKFFKSKNEEEDKILFRYPFFINGKILRFVTIFISTFVLALVIFFKERNKKDIIAICDPLNLQVSKAVRFAAKIFNIKAIAVVTDIPSWATGMKQHRYNFMRRWFQKKYESFCMNEIIAYDGYINLTKYMDSIVNPMRKPSVVIEGSVDIDVVDTIHDVKKMKKIIMYAGGVYEKYGLGMLVNGFVEANLDGVELHIYGEGSYVDTIIEKAKVFKNVKYMGVALNTDLPVLESLATLLVNPRFSNEEYTKYSFPSKTLEYMTSGTPVLTTKLKGIPEDYNPFIFMLNDETSHGMAEKLKEIFSYTEEFLNQFGEDARLFAKKKKNNVFQGRRIIDFSELVAGR